MNMKGTSYGDGKSNHNESTLDQNGAKIITSNVEHFLPSVLCIQWKYGIIFPLNCAVNCLKCNIDSTGNVKITKNMINQ